MKKLNRNVFRRNGLAMGIFVLLVLVGTAIGSTSAKYVKDAGPQQAVVRAKEFYFSSDLLKENGANYTLNPGTASISFVLRNHDDELRYSESPIEYTVSVSGDVAVSSPSGTLSNDDISITISNLVDGQSYIVTATGEAGYTKTLSATFIVRNQSEGVYKYLEMDPSGAFVLLTVWTENKSGEVTIRFPDGLIPDTTDEVLAVIRNYKNGQYVANTDGSGISDDAGILDVYSSHTYRFFQEDPFTDYSVEAFTVTVGGVAADPRTPE